MARTKITTDSANAFYNSKRFGRSNTQVLITPAWNTYMLLFGNQIARHSPRNKTLSISSAWRFSVTTKERLNWILKEFGAWKIVQKNYCRYYVDNKWNSTLRNWSRKEIDLNDYSSFTFIKL